MSNSDPHRSNAVVRPIPTDDERAAELFAQERESQRRRTKLYALTTLACVASCALGLFFMGWSMHTTNQYWAGIAFWSGLVIGNVGFVASLMISHEIAVHNGDLCARPRTVLGAEENLIDS